MNCSKQQSVVYVKCNKEDYSSVSPQAADLLLAVSNCQQRYSLFVHKKSLLRNAMNFSLGDSVTLSVANSTEVTAVIKYHGPLKERDGVFFGVQLEVTIVLYCVFAQNNC